MHNLYKLIVTQFSIVTTALYRNLFEIYLHKYFILIVKNIIYI